MADVAGVRDFQTFAHGGTDEAKRVATDIHVGDRLGNLGHVAGNALVAGAIKLMMRVLLNRGRMRPIGRTGAVTVETQSIRRLPQTRTMLRPMRVVAGEAGHAVRIHLALNIVVALHAVLVCGSVGKMSE